MDLLGGNTLLVVVLLANVFLLGVAVTAAYHHWRRHFHPSAQQPSSNLPDRIEEKILVQAQDNFEKVLRKSAAELGHDLSGTTARLNEHLTAITNDLMRKEVERYKETMTKLHVDATKKYGQTGSEIDTHTAEVERTLAERLKNMDEVLVSHQQELEAKMAARRQEVEHEFEQLQAEHAKKQAALESELAQKESQLLGELRQRETALASRQAELEHELAGRQQVFLAKQTELEQQLEAEMAQQRESYRSALDTKLSDMVLSFLSDTLGQHVDLGAQTPYLLQQLEAHKEELKQEIGQ